MIKLESVIAFEDSTVIALEQLIEALEAMILIATDVKIQMDYNINKITISSIKEIDN